MQLNSIRIGICFLFLLVSFSLAKADDSLIRYSWNPLGLHSYEKPDLESKRIDEIPYGAKVEWIEGEKAEYKEDVTAFQGYTLEGNWQKIRYKGREGYVFDGYLSDIPPLPRIQNGSTSTYHSLVEYLKSLYPLSKERKVSRKGANKYIELYTEIQRYSNGIKTTTRRPWMKSTIKTELRIPKEVWSKNQVYLFVLATVKNRSFWNDIEGLEEFVQELDDEGNIRMAFEEAGGIEVLIQERVNHYTVEIIYLSC